ncbi:LAMI_0F14356g1_1 [Lachancea mirantina]|uniref:LAMI_0F14356g1_1 n=1 Tax=Lachancea mirantina TaxID=1230905 RepID=A0A1G4K3U3_9SACH|nr:LAMI_0F14356g1_1 [Lachancea mirantina]
MRGGPRSIEDYLYHKLLESQAFHRFVRRIYYKINGIRDIPLDHSVRQSPTTFQPTGLQKFKAFRTLFWDEIRSTIGFPRRFR